MGSMAALVAILFSSCYQPIPKETPILSEDKIKLILRDIHLAEALLTEVADRRSKDSLARMYYGQIFKLHDVDQDEFDQSMHAYFTDPPALDSLYQEVISELAEEKKIAAEKKKADK